MLAANSMASRYPHLVSEWDSERNHGLDVNKVTYASNRKVWWICSKCGGNWEAYIANRTLKSAGCRFCSGNAVLQGFNDLETVLPNIAEEWHPTKNGNLLPGNLSIGSAVNVWWMCSYGHEWQTRVSDRVKGGGCNVCRNLRLPIRSVSLLEDSPEIAMQWDKDTNYAELSPATISRYSLRKVSWICAKNPEHKWEATVANRVRHKSGCPHCWRLGYSGAENEVVDFIRSLGITNIIQNDTIILDGKEVDILLPDYNLGIEYNGLYWHSEDNRPDTDYHYNKYVGAQKAGISLLQIWEDDWINRQPIVKRHIAYRLHKINELSEQNKEWGDQWSKKYMARKLDVVSLDAKKARAFLEENHIQGFAKGTDYLGLTTSENKIVAVLVTTQTADKTRRLISRYATKGVVVGGFTKLLTHFLKNHEIQSVITFADHTISDGKLYDASGFEKDGLVVPDYQYVKNKKRHHKFGFRLQKFRTDSTLLYDDCMNEQQLALLNGYTRIWDAGKTRYVYRNPFYAMLAEKKDT